MNPDLRKRFLIVIAAGLAVRYLLGILYTYPTDINYWLTVSENLAAGQSLYALPGYYYTPVWGYIIALVTPVVQFLGIPLGEYVPPLVGSGSMAQDWNCSMPSLEFALTVKTVLFAADVLVMFMVYATSRFMMDDRKAFLMAAFWFLCPFTIIISSVRVMFENIEILFMLVALYAMLARQPAAAGVAIGLSLMVKPYGIYLGILMIGFSFAQSRRIGYTMRYVLAAVFTGLLLMLPVFMEGNLAEAMKWLSNQSPGASSGSAYNFVAYLTPMLVGLSLVFSLLIAFNGSGDAPTLVTLTLMFTSAMLLVPGNIQYYLVLLPLVLLTAMPMKKLALGMFLLLSVFAFLSYNEWSAALYVHYGYAGSGLLQPFSHACSQLATVFEYNPVKTLTAVLAGILPVFGVIGGSKDAQ